MGKNLIGGFLFEKPLPFEGIVLVGNTFVLLVTPAVLQSIVKVACFTNICSL